MSLSQVTGSVEICPSYSFTLLAPIFCGITREAAPPFANID
jgi:hypothetical protein